MTIAEMENSESGQLVLIGAGLPRTGTMSTRSLFYLGGDKSETIPFHLFISLVSLNQLFRSPQGCPEAAAGR